MTTPGAPALLLHGQPGAGADWDDVARHLAPDLRCTAPDRPGYGSNPSPPGGLVTNAEHVLGELDRGGIAQTLLIGHSYGGGVALTVAALAPHRVRGLVLLASIGPGSVTGWDRLLAAPVTGEVCAVAAWQLTPWLARAHLAARRRMAGGTLLPGRWTNWQTWGDARYAHGAAWRTFLTEQRDFVTGTAALDDVVDRVTAPTLILADPGDTLVPVATAYALRDRLPSASLLLVPGAGHSLHRRAPTAVAGAIADFAAALS